jgi:mono/diheme cytochrome c family protein
MPRHLRALSILLLSTACSRTQEVLPPPYDRLAVPAGHLASPQAQERGRRLFLHSCAFCHGERADGKGVRRTALSTRPRDFTDPTWRRRTSPQRVFYVIREGVHGTAWKGLGDDATWDLVAFILAADHDRPLSRPSPNP